jgi:hypothetical protein
MIFITARAMESKYFVERDGMMEEEESGIE